MQIIKCVQTTSADVRLMYDDSPINLIIIVARKSRLIVKLNTIIRNLLFF